MMSFQFKFQNTKRLWLKTGKKSCLKFMFNLKRPPQKLWKTKRNIILEYINWSPKHRVTVHVAMKMIENEFY